MTHIVVLGAGPAGLGAALELAERGVQVTVLEQREVVGGNAGSFELAGLRVDYGSHRKGGYPIGSGAIESAHRFIGHVRLKRSGTWWYQENSNAILALRCALYNGTLNQVFSPSPTQLQRHAFAVTNT